MKLKSYKIGLILKKEIILVINQLFIKIKPKNKNQILKLRSLLRMYDLILCQNQLKLYKKTYQTKLTSKIFYQ